MSRQTELYMLGSLIVIMIVVGALVLAVNVVIVLVNTISTVNKVALNTNIIPTILYIYICIIICSVVCFVTYACITLPLSKLSAG